MRDDYTDAIRIGKVSSIDPEKCTAEVTFEDRDDIVSYHLPIMVPCTLKDKWYYMPAVEERVRVLFDPEAPSRGVILGSYYADNRLPPFDDENKVYVLFEDKTLIEYDKELHKLTIHIEAAGEKSIDIVAESDISVKTNGNITVEAAKNIKVEAAKDVEVDADNITLTGKTSISLVVGGTTFTLKPGGIVVTGDMDQDGKHTDSAGTHV